MDQSGFEVHFAQVDKTVEYVDMLNIPWYGSQGGDGGAFEPGRVTSFTTVKHKDSDGDEDLYLVVWWGREQPTPEEITAKIDAMLAGIV